MKRLSLVILFLIGSSSLFAQSVSNATIATDRNTYSPGDIVTITGTGWTPGETVTIDLDAVSPNRIDHTLQSIADASGNFVNQDFSGQDGDVGTHYNVTATGSVSGATMAGMDGKKVLVFCH